ERLLEELVGAKAEESGNRIVGLQDLPLEVRYEHGIRSVLDQALGVGSSLVQLPHVAQDADRADDAAVRIPQRGGVERRRDDFTARASRVEPGIASDTPLHHLPQGSKELPSFSGRNDARER